MGASPVRVHAAKSASGWTLETVDASSDVGRDASMALDPLWGEIQK